MTKYFKRMLFIFFPCLALGVEGLNGKDLFPDLQPYPQKITAEGGLIELKKPFYITMDNDQPVLQETAANILKKDLDKHFGIKAIVTNELIRPENNGVIIRLSSCSNNLPEEGYTINTSNLNINIQGNDNGIIYGCLTLVAMIKETTGKNNGIISLPERLHALDYPVMITRVCKILKKGNEKDLAVFFEEMTRWRFNTTYFDAASDKFNIVAGQAKKSGVRVYGRVSVFHLCKYVLKRPFCPCNPNDMALLESYFENAAKNGAYGLELLADDLKDPWRYHVKECPLCSKRFGDSMGKLQEAMIKKMVEIGKRHNVKDFIFCPTLYPSRLENYFRSREHEKFEFSKKLDHEKDGIYRNYFKDITASPELKEVKVFHCAFYPERIASLREIGLQNYIYWINGLYYTSYLFKHYIGLPRLSHLSDGFVMDPVCGPMPIKEAMGDLQNIQNLTKHVYIASGSIEGVYLGGIWLWNPPEYNEEKARKTVADDLYGPGIYEPLGEYERNISIAIAAFKAFPNTSAALESEEKKIESGEKADINIDKISKHLDAAVTAYKKIKGINPEMRWLPSMEKEIEVFKKKIVRKLDEPERLKKLTERYREENQTNSPGNDVIGWWRFEEPENLAKDDSRCKHSGKIYGNPLIVNGVIGKAAHFHGGRVCRVTGEMLSGRKEYISISPSEELKKIWEESFSVECWLKFGNPDVNCFIGNRSTINIWARRGWALGSVDENNAIRFIVDEGQGGNKKRSYIEISAMTTPIDFSGWLYIVAIRDTGKKELRLYVNGYKVEPVKDETADIANNDPVVIGYDEGGANPYKAGCYINGDVDEIKITTRALTEKEIYFVCP